MTVTVSEKSPDRFLEALEESLDHFGDADWLEANSPLAAPYFLGKFTEKRAADALRRLLKAAVELLDPDDRLLLDASFFKRDRNKNINGVVQLLMTSRAAYYRRRAAVLDRLADVLARQAAPALRLEQPLARSVLIGRERQLQVVAQALAAGHTVAVTGPSGVGKSALARAACAQLPDQPVFWHTLRAGLTDRFAGFCFALAYFLSRHGADSAWRQCVADGGKIDAARTLNLLRHDISALPITPLICIDECQLLQSDDEDHAHIVQLLQDLRQITPCVLIGQFVTLDPDRIVLTPPLDAAQTRTLLHELGLSALAEISVTRIFHTSRGNPALIRLLASFQSTPEDLASALHSDADVIETVFDRLWTRLSPERREILSTLAVFDGDAPGDLFRKPALSVELDSLRHSLLFESGDEVLTLPSAVRGSILRRLSPDERVARHLFAAQALEARATITSAVRHYLAARHPARAVALWHANRVRETELGHAPSALMLFENVTQADLPDDEHRRMLALSRAEILRALGKREQAEAALRAADWPQTHPETAQAQLLQGYLHEMGGDLNAAQRAFDAGLASFMERNRRVGTHLLMAKGYLHLRRREMDRAAQLALQARIEAEDFQAGVALEAGELERARQHIAAALEQCRALRDDDADAVLIRAKLHERMGRLEWQSGSPATSREHTEAARAIYAKRGDVVGVAYMHLNLAAANIVAGDYAQALQCCEESLPTAQALRHGYLLAVLSVNAAEACYYLNRIDDAERHAMHALEQEEETNAPYTFTVLGLIARARQDWPRAEANLQLAIDGAKQIADPYAEACALRWLGHVLQDQSKVDAAAAAFEQARQRFTDIGLSNEAAAT
jgi:energy-coupling factor transporter ATP-binding protein EcfA2